MPRFDKAVEIATHGKTDNHMMVTNNGNERNPRGRASSGPLYEPIRVAEGKKMPRYNAARNIDRWADDPRLSSDLNGHGFSEPITFSAGVKEDGQPCPALVADGLASLRAVILSLASLKKFPQNVTKSSYDSVKASNAWIMRGTAEGNRKKGSVETVNWLMFDADNMPDGAYMQTRAFLNTAEVDYLIYRTPGDGLDCKGNCEGFRVIIRCEEVAATIAEPVSRWMRENWLPDLGGVWDAATDEPTRLIYLPVIGAEVKHTRGEPFDVVGVFERERDAGRLSLVQTAERATGPADWGVYAPLVDCLLTVEGSRDEINDGVMSVIMPGQGNVAAYSSENNGDKWQFSSPRGGNEWIRFTSLHVNTEPADTFRIRDALACVPGALEIYNACNVEKKHPGQRETLERIRATREARLSTVDNVKHPEDLDLLPQTLEVGAVLCPLAAAVGVPMDEIYANAQPFPEGLIPYGVDLLAIDSFFRSAFWHPEKGRAYVMTPIGRLALYSKEDTSRVMQYFKPWFDHKAPALVNAIRDREEAAQKAQEQAQKKADLLGEPVAEVTPKRGRPKKKADGIDALAEAVVGAVCDKLRDVRNQASSLHRRIDMFAESADLTIDRNGVATFTQPFTPFDGGNRPDQRYVDDYREQFPGIEDLLKWILACRFASDRKTGFAWVQAVSNAGKGLCFGELQKMGVIVDMDANDLARTIKGNPAGYTADNFLTAWALSVNECREINEDFRKLENRLTLNTKNAMATTVDLFAKIFTSADTIKGLVGEHGVEAQFANRFNALAMRSANIEERALFTPSTKGDYAAALRYWFADVLNTGAAFYRELGPVEAARHADQEMARFFRKYALTKTAGSLADEFDNTRERFFAWVRKYSSLQYADRFPVLSNNAIKGDGFLFLRSPYTVFKEFVRQTYDATDAIGLVNNVRAILGDVRPVRVPGHDKPRGLWITAPDESASNSRNWMQSVN